MIAPIDGSLSFDYTKQRYTSQQPDALSIMKEITEFYLKKKGLLSYLVFNKLLFIIIIKFEKACILSEWPRIYGY